MAISRWAGGRSFTCLPPMVMLPDIDGLKPRDGAQQRGLAAARGADKHHEGAILHRRSISLQHLDGAIGLAQFFDLYF